MGGAFLGTPTRSTLGEPEEGVSPEAKDNAGRMSHYVNSQ